MSAPTAAPPASRPRAKVISARVVLALVCLIVFSLIAAAAWFYLAARAALPQLDGSIALKGLSAPVEVLRDAQGVPHIRAANLQDMLFAQGYITAQDRLWEMDMSRRYAAGDLAEILGSLWVKHDREQRILGLRQVAEKSAEQLSASDRELFRHYADGVNTFIATHRDRLPIEFRILRYQPRPWTLADSFLIGVNMAEFLNHDEFRQKLEREKITQMLGPVLAADLFPNISRHDHPPGQDQPQAPPANEDGDSEPRQPPDVTRLRPLTNNPNLEEEFAEPALRPGSNDWVISGAHTVTGYPLLSNDMHLRHQVPNVWYEAQLTAGDFDVAGVTLPGLPFVIVGHNRHIAWGFTNVGPDVEDIYVEHFNPQGQYQTPAGWQQPERRHEVIHVKGAPDVQFDVLLTRHGPIVSELARNLEVTTRADDGSLHVSKIFRNESRMLALRWALYDAGLSAPFGQIDAAQNWKDFRAAFNKFSAPGQNVVYADTDGHIGYQATGAIPIRASGNGALPLDGGDDAHEWRGDIPFEKLPSVYDPPSGILATANGRVTPDGYPYLISNEWDAPYRTERIYNMLGSGREFAAADMLALQTDVYSELDQLFAEKFAEAVDASPRASKRSRQAAALLRAWNGRMEKDSAAATIELLARARLLRMMLEPKLGEAWKDYQWYSSSLALENLLARQPKDWLPQGFPSYNQLLAAALEETVNAPAAPHNLASWRRGAAFPLTIEHPIFGGIPFLSRWISPGVVEQSGSGLSVKQVGPSFGPSERMTVDLSDLDASTLNIVTGESGQIFSRYAMDQWPAWYNGTSFALPFSSAAVSRAAAHKLELQPAH